MAGFESHPAKSTDTDALQLSKKERLQFITFKINRVSCPGTLQCRGLRG